MKNDKYNNHYKNVREPQLIADLSDEESVDFFRYLWRCINPQKENLPDEIWVDVQGFPKYEISNFTRIRNRERGGILMPYLRLGFYFTVILRQDGRSKDCSWSRLVAKHFIPNPENKKEVNHKNFIRIDNRPCNLEWTTPSENMQHSLQGQEYRFLKINQLDMDGNFIRQFNSINEAANAVKGRPSNIAYTAKGKFKYAYGHKWSFPDKSTAYRIPTQ